MPSRVPCVPCSFIHLRDSSGRPFTVRAPNNSDRSALCATNLPHLHRDWAHPLHICAVTVLAEPTHASFASVSDRAVETQRAGVFAWVSSEGWAVGRGR